MQLLQSGDLSQIPKPENLQECSVFGAFSLDAIRYLLQAGKVYRLSRNDLLFECGERGDSFFVVLDGSVDYFAWHFGDYSYTRTAGFGDEIGYVAMIALQDRAGKAVAREDSLVLEISANLFGELHDRYPFDFGLIVLNLARNMARLIRALSQSLASCRLGR